MEGTIDKHLESYVNFRNKHPAFSSILSSLREMSKNPKIESDIIKAIDLFMYTLNNPSNNNTLPSTTINYIEAALMLHNCGVVYSKKVDLLLEYVYECQKRLLGYEVKRSKILEVTAVSEEKINRLRRKHQPPEDLASTSTALNDAVLQHNAVDESHGKKLQDLWELTRRQITLHSNNNLGMGNYPTVMRQKLNDSIRSNDGILCNYEDMQMNFSIQSYADHKSSFERQFLAKECSTAVLEKDRLLQEYIVKMGISLAEMHKFGAQWAEFRQFSRERSLQVALTESLQEFSKRVCPSQALIKLTRLSTEVVKPYLGKCAKECEEMGSICKPPNRKDSGYFDSEMSDVANDSLAEDAVVQDESLTTEMFNSGIVLRDQISTPKRKKNTGSSDDEETPKKKRRSFRKEVSRKSLTTSLTEFESYYNRTYEPEEGEGEISCEDLLNDNDVDEEPFAEDQGITSTQSSVDSGIDEETSGISSNSKMKEWTNFILKRVDQESKRFDIHEYESDILESLSAEKPRTFKDIVRGKSSAAISKFFVASLQLANTNNINLSCGSPGTLASNSLSFQLLSKKRHHETLKTYEAPSELLHKLNLKECGNHSQEGVSSKKKQRFL